VNKARNIFLGMILLMGIQGLFYYFALPSTMAAHFGISGEANGWMPKSQFFIFYAILIAILGFAFLILIPALGQLPEVFIRLRQKGERIDLFKKRDILQHINNSMLWLGNLTQLLLLVVMQMVFECNRNGSQRLPKVIVYVLSAYIGGSFLLMSSRTLKFFQKQNRSSLDA